MLRDISKTSIGHRTMPVHKKQSYRDGEDRDGNQNLSSQFVVLAVPAKIEAASGALVSLGDRIAFIHPVRAEIIGHI